METETQLKGSLEEVDVFDEHVPQPDNIQRVTDEEDQYFDWLYPFHETWNAHFNVPATTERFYRLKTILFVRNVPLLHTQTTTHTLVAVALVNKAGIFFLKFRSKNFKFRAGTPKRRWGILLSFLHWLVSYLFNAKGMLSRSA